MAKRQSKREKRAAEIVEIARQFLDGVPPSLLLHTDEVMGRAEREFEVAMRSFTHEEYDRIAESERDAFLLAFIRAAIERAAPEVAKKREREAVWHNRWEEQHDRERSRRTMMR